MTEGVRFSYYGRLDNDKPTKTLVEDVVNEFMKSKEIEHIC